MTDLNVLSELLQKGADYLLVQDNDWKRLISHVGPCQFEPRTERDPYEALVRAVAYQQLHSKAADAILSRMLGIYQDRFPSAEELVETESDTLRACGFSSRKIETIKAIAQARIEGDVPDRQDAETMDDEELIARLTKLKGIGRWTVEMLLIFTLARMDVFPLDDLGLKEGYRRLKSLSDVPARKEMESISITWSPYRTIAAWYLWRVPKTWNDPN